MVKVEDYSNNDISSDPDGERQKVPKVEPLELKPDPEMERTNSSSSHCQLKSYFVGMGFSPTLVDTVIKENGDDDANLLLEVLFTHTALQKASPADGLSNAVKEEIGSPFEFSSDDEQAKGLNEPSNVDLDHKKSYLLMMDFSEEEVAMAINELGENALLAELVDFIVSAQTGGCSNEKETCAETLFGTMDKTLCLLRMGFTEKEVSSAIEELGVNVPIGILAESISASRMPDRVIKEEEEEENQNESWWRMNSSGGASKRYYPASEFLETNSSTSEFIHDFEDVKRIKKAKYTSQEDFGASCSYYRQQTELANSKQFYDTGHAFYDYDVHKNSTGASVVKEESPDQMTSNRQPNSDASWIKDEKPDLKGSNARKNVCGLVPKPPYFFYGNVVDVPQDTWKKLSQFLYAYEPEFVNSQFFSVFIRKEGYIHNLPMENRFHILPKPPKTIEDALPHTKKWWPSWDTRKQLSCINTDSTGVVQLCERLGKMMINSRGMLSKEQQMDMLHQCKTANLIWVGLHKLRQVEPDQIEDILGYPMQHTQVWGLETLGRLKALRYSFQTDTLGYHLSVLKPMYPGGLRVLSVCSGVGGAEVTLHRLGIHLKCVVSVEASETNRKILKRWWLKTGQTGVLLQVGGVEMLTSQKLESIVKEHGGIDLVIGGNPGIYASGNSTGGDFSMGMDLSLFFEFVRLLQRVRNMMARKR